MRLVAILFFLYQLTFSALQVVKGVAIGITQSFQFFGLHTFCPQNIWPQTPVVWTYCARADSVLRDAFIASALGRRFVCQTELLCAFLCLYIRYLCMLKHHCQKFRTSVHVCTLKTHACKVFDCFFKASKSRVTKRNM